MWESAEIGASQQSKPAGAETLKQLAVEGAVSATTMAEIFQESRGAVIIAGDQKSLDAVFSSTSKAESGVLEQIALVPVKVSNAQVELAGAASVEGLWVLQPSGAAQDLAAWSEVVIPERAKAASQGLAVDQVALLLVVDKNGNICQRGFAEPPQGVPDWKVAIGQLASQ
mmetsp:Transcript_7082/g.11151  ORF Transcript_7082/g.11151 Transcript_7082/m.11151 type:complete len:170 (-) Transcript_7082:61-570(-)